MEKLQKPWLLPFVSEERSVSAFFTQANGVFDRAEMVLQITSNKIQTIGLKDKEFGELLGTDKNQLFHTFNDTETLADSKLLHSRYRKVEFEARKKLAHRQAANSVMRYRRFDFAQLQRKGSESDVLLKVVVCKPYNRPLAYHEIRMGRLLVMDSAFVVRGRSLLLELKRVIHCVSDYADGTPIRSASDILPDGAHLVVKKDDGDSAFLFINDTFYNYTSDGRLNQPNAQSAGDLSAPIRAWAATRDSLGTLQNGPAMGEMRFEDLTLRLGFPYLYRHQSCCDHLVIFTEMNWSNKCCDVGDYPMCITKKVQATTVCHGCKKFSARYVTHNDLNLPTDPCFLCGKCFMKWTFDEGGNVRRGTCYPFIDRLPTIDPLPFTDDVSLSSC